jgi:hypothetical protein
MPSAVGISTHTHSEQSSNNNHDDDDDDDDDITSSPPAFTDYSSMDRDLGHVKTST